MIRCRSSAQVWASPFPNWFQATGACFHPAAAEAAVRLLSIQAHLKISPSSATCHSQSDEAADSSCKPVVGMKIQELQAFPLHVNWRGPIAAADQAKAENCAPFTEPCFELKQAEQAHSSEASHSSSGCKLPSHCLKSLPRMACKHEQPSSSPAV